MPQAAFADSTTAPQGQQTFTLELVSLCDEIEEAGDMFATLGESACLAIESGNVTKDFTSGLDKLFKHAAFQLKGTRNALYDVSERLKGKLETAQQAKTPDALFAFRLHNRIVDIARAVRIENDQPVWATDEEWPAEELAAFLALTKHYCQMLLAKLEGPGDLLEAGSFLPWIETVIRRDLAFKSDTVAEPAEERLQAIRQSLPDVPNMRDQFIAQAYAEGFSPTDISLSLGMEQAVVLRTIRRLTREATTQTTGFDEARTA